MALSQSQPVALVTGANRGIGRAISLALAGAGYILIGVARSQGTLCSLADEIAALGGQAVVRQVDVTDEAEVGALFQEVASRFGRLDVLVNNAGQVAYGPLREASLEEYEGVMDVNLKGPLLFSREALRLMEPRGSGTILNIASVEAHKGYANHAIYAASKHALLGLSKSLAVEAQPYGIRVSVICPGAVNTEMARSARPDLDPADLIHPQDVAQAVMYLVSLSPFVAVDQLVLRRTSSTPFG